MRQDTKVLLGRLGEETFRYYDFESPSAQTDVWPMFEALLLDERVVGRVTRDGAPVVPPAASVAVAEPVAFEQPAQRPVVPVEPRGMFGNYGAASAVDDVGESVRDQLQRLSAPRR